ncbi:hypothetical protein K469DRAFT_556420 [Zopfia rhizophila CBS 207.26]|uniref:DUF4048 domain-containing protein n=1 Tax=Zopfia rhizophila CBS 207.26 TaxID=1314779 RepID=A0A6A6EPH5_9PEZI|nr:hypothetical protein K469DRAFT_556420 [Zopfia rhizophila CBS 207.26]
MSSHTRSMSHADVVKQGKRLSLHFPIQPPTSGPSPGISPRSRPQSWVAAPSPISPEIVSSPTEGNFLAVLAAQERRVLELKEELLKAEDDLKNLKRHWATHEAVKKRNEGRKITQLQPLNTALANYPGQDDDDPDGSTLWLQREMERRKALLTGTKASQRKVFSGSRHMRTLSLLSPDKATYTPSFPQPLDIREPKEDGKRAQNLPRTVTSPDVADQIASIVNDDRYDLGGLSNIQRDALLRTGKQMATDFKDGLLTFIEDIRQATVGEEAASGVDGSGNLNSKGASKNSRKTVDGRPTLNRAASSKKAASAKTGDIGNEFWKEHGLDEPKSAPTKMNNHLKNARTPQKSTQTVADDFEDTWDSWDTPNDKYLAKAAPSSSSSSDESDEPSSPVSGRSSARTSTRYHSKRHDSKASLLTISSSAGPVDESSRDPKRNSIPWPDLVKLSPNNLKRTASHLMKEWEKNLTPPPESRDASHASGDYIGRSASPARLP